MLKYISKSHKMKNSNSLQCRLWRPTLKNQRDMDVCSYGCEDVVLNSCGRQVKALLVALLAWTAKWSIETIASSVRIMCLFPDKLRTGHPRFASGPGCSGTGAPRWRSSHSRAAPEGDGQGGWPSEQTELHMGVSEDKQLTV